ncbi:uncharacterized protein YidB (DUF937 family) [Prosthecobacter fusiformis]|uniref:Uncharacterized protein YidB (DUF937 family) n=1 Tax=Prosthecobacter fusiformis TaxID=48464 RepID=A0A4R7S6L2_9BACT|nr:YidB family protein [Prosthecobacter fusiformis]TDU73085.1 uncharacterized protein YidB (DUF937 family) [Prosthecobacter fusiformis]
MGLFDSLAKQALGGIFGGGSKQGDMLTSLMNQAGGLGGLMQQFQQAGLGETFASWVSADKNLPVQPDQLEAALGSQAVQDLAAKLGFDAKMVLPLMSQFLPQIIDRLTPNGVIDDTHPSTEKLQEVLSGVMKSGLGGLFGGRS